MLIFALGAGVLTLNSCSDDLEDEELKLLKKKKNGVEEEKT